MFTHNDLQMQKKHLDNLMQEAKDLEMLIESDICSSNDKAQGKQQLEKLKSKTIPDTERYITTIELKLSSAISKPQPIVAAPKQEEQKSSSHSKKLLTESDIQKIKDFYQALPDDDLKSLIDHLLIDDITYEFIEKPVFIRGEGKRYDLQTLVGILGDKKQASSPNNPNLKFNLEDILPCNSIIDAMHLLLRIINGETVSPSISSGRDIPKISLRHQISAEQIKIIEAVYATFTDQRKALFDVICRDPLTHQIMDSPVLLPNGYVYDMSTIKHLLSLPGNTYTQDNFVTCCYVNEVLDTLKEKAEKFKALQVNAQIEKKLLPTAEAEAKRNKLVEELISYLATVKSHNSKSHPYTNLDMEHVLNAAVDALNNVNPERLSAAKKAHPKYDEVKTVLGGKQNSSTFFSKAYQKFAIAVGTVKEQPGLIVKGLVKKAKTMLVELSELVATEGHKQEISVSSTPSRRPAA